MGIIKIWKAIIVILTQNPHFFPPSYVNLISFNPERRNISILLVKLAKSEDFRFCFLLFHAQLPRFLKDLAPRGDWGAIGQNIYTQKAAAKLIL